MLVIFKRNWFSPDGIRYRARDGLQEIPERFRDLLPKDAEVYEGGNLPSKSIQPKPGFGAKPIEEQITDLIPGASPVHVLEPNRQSALGPGEDNTPEGAERRARAAEAEAALQDRKGTSAEALDKKHAETQEAIDKGLGLAHAAEDVVTIATDPVQAAAEGLIDASPVDSPEPPKEEKKEAAPDKPSEETSKSPLPKPAPKKP